MTTTEYQSRLGLVEDIMTPRSLLMTVSKQHISRAADIATEHDFDAIPISDDDRIVGFWSRVDGKRHDLNAEHVVAHDQLVVSMLDRLIGHGVQFVAYRDQIVGLVDLSDLNKPLARVVVAHPLLLLEQVIVMEFRRRSPDESDVSIALGERAAKAAKARRRRTQPENLDAPLLEFAYFADILRVAFSFKLISTCEDDINRLNNVRNRVLHPAHRLVEERRHGDELLWAMKECGTMLTAVLNAAEREQH